MNIITTITLFFMLSASIYADTVQEIIDINYKNNHFTEYKNYSMTKQGRNIPVLMHKDGTKQSKLRFEQFQVNTDVEKHLFVYHSGKFKGFEVLVALKEKETDVNLWIPQLRTTKKINTFDTTKAWNGSNFTYGEVMLQNPNDYRYEIVGKTGCLVQNRNLDTFKKNNYALAENKQVIKVKAAPKNFSAEFDYKILYMDKKTYHDYRIEYYKGEEVIKTIEKGWYKPKEDVTLVSYWYAKDYINNSESLIYIPKESNVYNTKLSKEFSKKSLNFL